jgi:hypothetical protein
MLYRVHVSVVTAMRAGLPASSATTSDDGWAETVSYFFGVNAETAASAAALAEQAAEHARDRDGRYIGGAVLELQVRSAAQEEFSGYEPYLLKPITARGIFYVTGTTTSGLPEAMIRAVLERLAEIRESIRLRGVPPPSFVHPKPPDPPFPSRTRLVCPGCRQWTEVDSAGVIYSLVDGLDPGSRESQVGRQTGVTLGQFIETHMPCLKTSSHVSLVFLHPGDPGYDNLDPAFEA